jgi:hypothetical protein
MTRRTLAAPFALALVTAALVAPASSGAASGCTAGVTTVAGKKVNRFCGPAKATATAGGKTFSFAGGSCAKNSIAFTINIGSIAVSRLPNAKPATVPYFGLTIAPGDTGVHLGQAITWIEGGKKYAVFNNTATLGSNGKKGSFKGTLYPGGGAVKGTFSC